MDIDPIDVFEKKENIVTRNVAGETLLVPISGQLADLEQIFVLNDVGAFVWGKLDGRFSVENILSSMCKEYEVALDVAGTDLSELLNNLFGAGLIVKAE